MAKKPGMVLDFSVRLRGELAEVFESLRIKEKRQKSEFARDLILEALRARGLEDLKDEIEWGGYRPPRHEDDEEEVGQLAAVAQG